MMTQVSRSKERKWLRISLTVGIFLFLSLVGAFYFVTNIHYLDRPFVISDRRETIEVDRILWACDCADWLETKYYKSHPHYEAREEDCIFIEAADKKNRVPENVRTTRLRLTGSFYSDKGISRDYDASDDIKPAHARVFRYEKYEILKKGK